MWHQNAPKPASWKQCFKKPSSKTSAIRHPARLSPCPRNQQAPRSSKTCHKSSDNQHLKSTASQRRQATSNAKNVESTSINVSMKQPSNSSSQANVWIRPSLKPMGGHRTHNLWQTRERVRCAQCGTQWHLDGQKRIITTQALTKPCKGAGLKGSPPLSEFLKGDAAGSTAEKHQPSLQATEPVQPASNRPTPRRLHFSTELDARDEVSSNSGKEDEEGHMTVDYF